MPIVIQDLLASDTISQAADKINFNFDQLILNGGGAPGPAGPAGPTGPAGGRGLRGATWYKDTTPTPGVDPNSIIILGLNNDDLYLQANGQIWRYNGNVWTESLINLTGPQGEQGPATGFAYVGGFPGQFSIANENVAFPIVMISGSGATANNQGVSTLMVGAVGGNAVPPPGITFDSSFKISDEMAKQLDSSLVSTLIHQKNSASSAIRFMGGGELSADKYEQDDLQKLTSIALGIDDSFNINVPKAATNPTSLSNLIGFNLNTIKKGQQFYAGKYIKFISGADSQTTFGAEVSDVIFNVNTSNIQKPAKFSAVIIGSQNNAKFEIGGSITLPENAGDQFGTSLTLANIIHLTGNQIELKRNSTNRINVSNTGVIIQTGDGPLALSTTSSRPININANGSVGIEAATAISVKAATGISIDSSAAISVKAATGISIDSSAAISVKAATGISIDSSAAISVKAATGISIDSSAAISVKAVAAIGIDSSAAINIKAVGAIGIDSSAAISVKAATGISIDSSAAISVKADTGISIDSSAAINIKATTGITNTGNVTITGTLGVGSNTTVGGTLKIGNVTPGNGDILVRDASGEVRSNNNFAIASMPVGGIIMWSGASVPPGYALCNGQTVGGVLTPDLRGRFIVGQDPRTSYPGGTIWDLNYNGIGNTGGAKDVTLTESQMPSHTHGLNTNRHLVGNVTAGDLQVGGPNREAVAARTQKSASSPPNIFTSGISNTGGDQAHENRPPYYVLAFIMFVGV